MVFETLDVMELRVVAGMMSRRAYRRSVRLSSTVSYSSSSEEISESSAQRLAWFDSFSGKRWNTSVGIVVVFVV